MQPMKFIILSATTIYMILLSGMTQAFDFDFDSDDDPPGWVEGYWQPAPRYNYYPQMNSFDRSDMIRNRQHHMQYRASTMRQLGDLLSGRFGFDRAEAVRLARKIENTAGYVLSRDFHPGAVIDSDSRTTRSFWGNEEIFRKKSEDLQKAAKALADELEKEPTKEEGGVYLRSRKQSGDHYDETEAVSPAIWQKYTDLSVTCNSCHHNFRSPFNNY
jgi:cytochrome c556